MYNFVDTNEVAAGGILPAEALQINGEYIENLINGYRTLSVTGREALAPIVSTFETGVRDGSALLNKRYPERIITIKYQLIAKTNEDFREAYNKLGEILNVKDAQLIFNDETDKFFTGTPCNIAEVDGGKNAVIGEFELLCTDPFKYSVIEYEAQPSLDEKSILIDYNGTYKAYPILEAQFFDETEVGADGETAVTLTGKGDCGYVAFFNENEKIIQLGDPEEVDGIEGAYPKSQTLANQTFLSSTAWGGTAQNLWKKNAGFVTPATVQQLGTMAMQQSMDKADIQPAKTSAQTLIKIRTTQSAPKFIYAATAKVSGRTQSAVTLDISLTATLGASESYFGRGLSLNGAFYIGGAWHTIPIKKESEYWKGSSGHTVNKTITVTGLTESTASLTGIKFRVTRGDTGGTAGTLSATACNDLKINTYAEYNGLYYYLTPTSYGAATGCWHGPSITRELGADATGEVGAKNFALTFLPKMSIGNGKNALNEVGAFQVNITTADGQHIAGMRVYKHKAGKNGTIALFINGEKKYETIIDLSYGGKYFGKDPIYNGETAGAAYIASGIYGWNTAEISKDGNNIKFTVGKYTYWRFWAGEIADLKAAKITFSFEQYSELTPLSYNGLFWAKFVKNNCQTMQEIPNKFSANDVLEADCKDGKIYLNGIETASLGALGNDWENLYLTKGLNQIGFSYSDWVTAEYAPKLKVRYREVFL